MFIYVISLGVSDHSLSLADSDREKDLLPSAACASNSDLYQRNAKTAVSLTAGGAS